MAKEGSNLPHTHCQKGKSLLNHPGNPLVNTQQYLTASLLCPVSLKHLSTCWPEWSHRSLPPFNWASEDIPRFVWWRLSSAFYRQTMWHTRGWEECLTLYCTKYTHTISAKQAKLDVI